MVCFPLGTWVGGLFTLACVRHLAAKGYPITAVAPGNNKAKILRVIPELAAHCDQTVLLGYPPFVKDVIDTGIAAGLDWTRYAVKLVLAGEDVTVGLEQPAGDQLPVVTLRLAGDPEYFAVGVKHRYTRGKQEAT